MRLFFAAVLFSTGIAAQTFQLGLPSDPCLGGNIWSSPPLRFGDFTCTIPAALGPYTVTLNFQEPAAIASGVRLFNVTINGSQVLASFDLVSAGATSSSIVIAKSFPVTSDGSIRIQLSTVKRSAVLSSITVAPLPTTGTAIQAADLIDCKVTVSGSTATVAAPCSLKTGAVTHSLSMPATATLSGIASQGTVYFYWSYDGHVTASQATAAKLACNAGCQVGSEALPPQYSWPIAQADFVQNAFTAVTDLRGSYSTNIYLCGQDLSCKGRGDGTIVIEAGPNLVTKAQLQAGQVTLCLDSGPVNAMACSPASPYNGYTTGMVVQVVPANTNTGAVTLAISGLSARQVKKADGITDLSAGDLIPGRQTPLSFDGTVFRLLQ